MAAITATRAFGMTGTAVANGQAALAAILEIGAAGGDGSAAVVRQASA